MLASDVDSIVAAAREHPRTALGQPVVVALDGRSGVGKSTLAAILIKRLGAVVVAGDDFYTVMDEGTRWALDPAEGVACYFDWTRLRDEALAVLRSGRTATFRPFAWSAGEGLTDTPVTLSPRQYVVVEGVYTARPELSDFIDVTVLVVASEAERLRRVMERGHGNDRWHSRWESAEELYFTSMMPPHTFDLVVRSA